MSTSDVLDEMLRPDEVPDTPTGGVESLAGGTDSQGALVELRGHGPDSCEWDIKEAVVDFVRKNDEVMLHAESANAL